MKGRVWLLLLLLCAGCLLQSELRAAQDDLRKIVDPEEEGIHLRSILPTPVYSLPWIPSLYYDYKLLKPRLKLDALGHMRELEFIALKGSKFVHHNTYKFGRIYVYEVTTEEYTSTKRLYIDGNYVVRCFKDDPEREVALPAREEIIAALQELEGVPYRWGGNVPDGIVEQLKFYPIGEIEDYQDFIAENRSAWILEGVDCSGMLYAATQGATPRNTSELVGYGTAVAIAGLDAEAIIQKLEPLDLIVWKGHVLVVLDSETVIESRPRYPDKYPGGVRIHSLKKRLEEIMQEREPVDSYPEVPGKKVFVVRRFIAQA